MKVAKSAWSKRVRDLDSNRCAFCGSTERLEAHHIKPKHSHPDLECELENGITLCRSCHITAHNGDFSGLYGPEFGRRRTTPQYGFKYSPAEVLEFIDEYENENEILYCYVPRRKAKAIRDACKRDGVSINAVLTAAIDDFMAKAGKPSEGQDQP